MTPTERGAAPPQGRPLAVDDLYALRDVADPRISPDGRHVAYTVSRLDREGDRSDTDIWRVPRDGGEALRLTTSEQAESRPRWSPDGRWLAFLSGREGDESQVWLLPTAGGEASRLTDLPGGVSDLAWSPDGTRLAVVAKDPEGETAAGEEPAAADPEGGGPGEDAPAAAGDEAGGEERPEPIVVTRLQFKRDGVGYLDDRRDHVHVVDVPSGQSFQLTRGPYDDAAPAWSPAGDLLAFVSNRNEEPDASDDTDVWVVEVREGAEPRRLTVSPGADGSPSFSPDGGLVAFVAGGDPADVWYDTNDVALVTVNGGEPPTVLTGGLDRFVADPRFTPDGESVLFRLEERNVDGLASVPATGGAVTRVLDGPRSIQAFDQGPAGELVALEARLDRPAEVVWVEADGDTVRLTTTNDDLLGQLELAPVEVHQATSTGGVTVDFFLTLPPGGGDGPFPTLLRIHGGPVSQFTHAFEFEWQLFAAHGYAVVAANPRGSSGRGREFSRAIWADWGNLDFDDVMAAVDRAVEMGVADPERLGVGGWSYGGILTNYVITRTDRFRAAISGASEVNYTANYGHDHYQLEWETELGLPWESTDLWIRLSPFFRVDRVTTPTLVMCGQEDWNVPLQNSEQLYQALRRLGVPTRLVIYPGESHGISRPSFQVDRYERYLDWYDRWVKGGEGGSATPRE